MGKKSRERMIGLSEEDRVKEALNKPKRMKEKTMKEVKETIAKFFPSSDGEAQLFDVQKGENLGT